MTTAPRALRVGILLGDNLVEERVFRDHAPITFGQSLRCALSIPGDGIPHEHVLFVRDEGRVLLRPLPGMTGKIAQGGAVRTELAGGIAIEKGARGKLQLGDATILFQEIAAPPIAPRPVLPASLRGSLGDRIDRRLAVIIGASVLAHLGIAIAAWIDDADTHSMLETPVAQQYRQEMIDVTIPDEPSLPTTAVDPGPGAATPVAPVQTARPIVSRPRVTTQAPTAMTEGEAQRIASILTGEEVGQTGASDLNKRQPGADLGKQIDAVGDRRIVVGNEDGGFRQRPREGIDPDKRQVAGDPDQIRDEIPKGPERDPRTRIQIRPLPAEGPGTTLTVKMVLDKINAVYMPGLQRCYKKGLLGDSTLSGKVALSFTVTERGGLDEAKAAGVTSEVDACISSAMATWHFAIPRDKDGEATEQGFKLALALQPG